MCLDSVDEYQAVETKQFVRLCMFKLALEQAKG